MVERSVFDCDVFARFWPVSGDFFEDQREVFVRHFEEGRSVLCRDILYGGVCVGNC